MTPEERATACIHDIMPKPQAGRAHLIECVTKAVQETENAALERVAQLLDDKQYIGDHHDEMCRAIQETAVEDFAISAIDDIRALKHKKA